MDRLKNMKEQLISCVQSQISGNLANVDTKELGEAVDMIKDLSEAIYYCSIAEAMEEQEEKEEHKAERHYYKEIYMPIDMNGHMGRDMDREHGRMYYPGPDMMYYNGGSSGGSSSGGSRGGSSSSSGGRGGSSGGGRGGSSYYSDEYSYPMEIRDYREGKSPVSRKNYMESKELHHDKAKQMKELEKYLQELATDVTEMVEDASPEEKSMLHQKLTMLASKVK